LTPDFKFDASNISASKDNFSKQMEYLSKNYNVISLKKFMEYKKNNEKIPKNTVVITFDDGYNDSYKNAYPILKKFDLPATIYLTTGYIGNDKIPWWDAIAYMILNTKVKSFEVEGLGKYVLGDRQKVINAIKNKFKNMKDKEKNVLIAKLSRVLNVTPPKMSMFLNWKDIKAMDNISFGAHTVNHPILTNIPLKEAESEIRDSKSIIEKYLGKKVLSFAYPNGHEEDLNRDIVRVLRKEGFENAVTYIPGWANSDPFKLKRVFVAYEDDMLMFKSKLIGLDIFFGKIYYFFNDIIGKKR
jgi:peptidoglycan/xylan/chitin deacetylase (PgdA/CDA1 family)